MILGTHNSLSFATPRKWYMWFMKPFAKCQKYSLEEQYKRGARCFDIRIRFEKHVGKPIFAHGLYELKIEPTYLFNFLYNAKTKIYVRLILESNKNRELDTIWFNLFIIELKNRFPKVTFFGGNRKGDWEQIVDFDFKPNLIQNVGSMAKDARWYEKIMPFAYAKRCNKKNMVKEYKNDDIVIYDFL